MPVINPRALILDRTEAISSYHLDAGLDRAQLDVSGGIDSAVMLGLLCLALGPDQVTAVTSSIHSSPTSRLRAKAVADRFGCRLVDINLTDIYDDLVGLMVSRLVAAGFDDSEVRARIADDPTVLGSIRSTLRAPVGRGFNRLSGGGIRHGTGNECEDRFLRFFQKGGDGEVDTNPLAMLSKGEVYQLALALEVPEEIISAIPTPDLWGSGDAHNDEDELLAWTGVPFSYSRVDVKTGLYHNVGTIERVSRFLDSCDDALFRVTESELDVVLAQALKCPAFAGLDDDMVLSFCRAARRIETITRHKENPSATPLGDRADLVVRGILSNDLPSTPAG